MTDIPTGKKLSERFGGFDSAEQQERAVFMDAFDGADSKLFAKGVAAGIAALDKLRALRLSESHSSTIREAVEGEREACAKIADRRADSSNKDCERLSFDGSTGTLECSLSHRSDCLCQEHQEEAEAIAAAIRARGEEKGK